MKLQATNGVTVVALIDVSFLRLTPFSFSPISNPNPTWISMGINAETAQVLLAYKGLKGNACSHWPYVRDC
jgi:hypothetical protein